MTQHQTGDNTGDGKTSPFGDGDGGTGDSKMQGTDFIKNPGGEAPVSPGNNFLTDPGGKPSIKPPEHDYINMKPAAQPTGTPSSINPQSIVGNQSVRVPLADVPANSTRQTGAGSIGNNQKPFKFTRLWDR